MYEGVKRSSAMLPTTQVTYVPQSEPFEQTTRVQQRTQEPDVEGESKPTPNLRVNVLERLTGLAYVIYQIRPNTERFTYAVA